MNNTTRKPMFKVGDKVSHCLFTDRHAGYITRVSKSGKTVYFQRCKATRIDSHGMSDCQEYSYADEPMPNYPEIKFTFRGYRGVNPLYKEVGVNSRAAGQCLARGHAEYYDFSF